MSQLISFEEAKHLLDSLLTFCPKISKQYVADHKQIDPKTIEAICLQAQSILQTEESFIELRDEDKYDTRKISKTILIGDIHGQYYDLIRILHSQKLNERTRFIFLGDIVDRGPNSTECVLIVLLMKILWPKQCFIIRGNHECPEINRAYGFEKECNDCFEDDIAIWAMFNAVFQFFPLCLSIHDRIFCVHGGISPSLDSLDSLRNINRNDLLVIPDEGLVTDLTWADPHESASQQSSNGFAENDRGCSYIFSETIAKKFCEKFGFDFICRAHQCVQDGYEFFGGKSLLTIFSASNYCGDTGNFGAILSINSNLECDIVIYEPLDSTELIGSSSSSSISKKQYSFVTKNPTEFYGSRLLFPTYTASSSSSSSSSSSIYPTQARRYTNEPNEPNEPYHPGIVQMSDMKQFVKENEHGLTKNYHQRRDKSPPPFRTRSDKQNKYNKYHAVSKFSADDSHVSLMQHEKQHRLMDNNNTPIHLVEQQQKKRTIQNLRVFSPKSSSPAREKKELSRMKPPDLSMNEELHTIHHKNYYNKKYSAKSSLHSGVVPFRMKKTSSNTGGGGEGGEGKKEEGQKEEGKKEEEEKEKDAAEIKYDTATSVQVL